MEKIFLHPGRTSRGGFEVILEMGFSLWHHLIKSFMFFVKAMTLRYLGISHLFPSFGMVGLPLRSQSSFGNFSSICFLLERICLRGVSWWIWRLPFASFAVIRLNLAPRYWLLVLNPLMFGMRFLGGYGFRWLFLGTLGLPLIFFISLVGKSKSRRVFAMI